MHPGFDYFLCGKEKNEFKSKGGEEVEDSQKCFLYSFTTARVHRYPFRNLLLDSAAICWTTTDISDGALDLNSPASEHFTLHIYKKHNSEMNVQDKNAPAQLKLSFLMVLKAPYLRIRHIYIRFRGLPSPLLQMAATQMLLLL